MSKPDGSNKDLDTDVSFELIEAIKSFPLSRAASHCGKSFAVPPFDVYATCPQCGMRIKVRAFTACPDVASVFEAVFEWLSNKQARSLYEKWRAEVKEIG